MFLIRSSLLFLCSAFDDDVKIADGCFQWIHQTSSSAWNSWTDEEFSPSAVNNDFTDESAKIPGLVKKFFFELTAVNNNSTNESTKITRPWRILSLTRDMVSILLLFYPLKIDSINGVVEDFWWYLEKCSLRRSYQGMIIITFLS